ncbi:MAG: hypothetical protein ACFFEK_09585 [Candidatus Thorarchaeota archaeon]
MGETYRGSATQLTEQRTDQMIVIISIGLVLALVVGGFVVAAHSYGDQKQEPTDNNQENIAIDYFDPAEVAQLQTFRKPDFVMESESGRWGPMCTEQGSIDFYYDNLPSCLPLCITNETLKDYYVQVIVYGGYTPWELGSYITVCQKDDYKGTIFVNWTEFEGQGGCCATFYNATFYVEDNFCLESSQYPAVNSPWKIDQTPGETIPDKEVYLCIRTFWTGCRPHEQPSQDFTIIHSHSHQAFSKQIILNVKTHTFCIHKQSTWWYNQTALVQDIFEPKKPYKGGVILGPSTSSNI